MHEALPSKTALRVALRRAAHQIHDKKPLVFDDPLAVPILGVEYREELKRTPDADRRPFSAALRAFMVVRARLAEELRAAGFDPKAPTVTAWLGVVPYLTLEAFRDTTELLGGFAEGSEVVFDYSQPIEALPPVEQLMLASLSSRVAQAGEPFRLFFTPDALETELKLAGLEIVADLDGPAMTARYLAGRKDGLQLRGRGGRICVARAR